MLTDDLATLPRGETPLQRKLCSGGPTVAGEGPKRALAWHGETLTMTSAAAEPGGAPAGAGDSPVCYTVRGQRITVDLLRRVSITAERGAIRHVDGLDIKAVRRRKAFVSACAAKFKEAPERIENDLVAILEACEARRSGARKESAAGDFLSHTVAEATAIVLRDLAIRDYSRYTIRGYRLGLGRFAAFLLANGAANLSDVTEGLVESFQSHLFASPKRNGLPKKIGTIEHDMRAVKAWGRCLVRLGYLERSPAEWIEMGRSGRNYLTKAPSEKEVMRILKSFDDRIPWQYRDRAIVELLYGAALRVGELCALDLGDVDPERGTVTIREGKSGSSGVVPMGSVASEYLEGYIHRVRPLYLWKSAPKTTLFLGGRGERITSVIVEEMLARAVKRAGVKMRVTPHTLRAAAATHMLQRGADLRSVQEMLRHKTISATQHYLRSTGDRTLAKIYARFHPRSRM